MIVAKYYKSKKHHMNEITEIINQTRGEMSYKGYINLFRELTKKKLKEDFRLGKLPIRIKSVKKSPIYKGKTIEEIDSNVGKTSLESFSKLENFISCKDNNESKILTNKDLINCGLLNPKSVKINLSKEVTTFCKLKGFTFKQSNSKHQKEIRMHISSTLHIGKTVERGMNCKDWRIRQRLENSKPIPEHVRNVLLKQSA
jgi:hypothetical protein